MQVSCHGKHFGEGELRGQQIEKSKFMGCKFAGVNLKFSAFAQCEFENCDFVGVLFEVTSFESCSFEGSKLSYLDFSPVRFKSCSLNGSVIENSVFRQLKPGAENELERYDLTGCSFVETTLSNTVFVKCDLTKVDMSRAKLAGAAFDRCKLKEARLVGAEIAGASWEGSIIDKTELDYQGFLQFGQSRGFVLGVEG